MRRDPPIAQPFLACDKCGAATRHKLVRREPVGQIGDFALIFACSPCGTERRWGLTGPKTTRTDD